MRALLRDWKQHGELATFTPNRKLPVYNWFYYKEGFARGFVWQMVDRFKPNGTVLDPFCGSGTTLLACAEKGIPSVGCDLQPAALLASWVKTHDYNIEQLRAAADELLRTRFYPVQSPVLPIMKAAFSRHNLADVLFWKRQIDTIPDR